MYDMNNFSLLKIFLCCLLYIQMFQSGKTVNRVLRCSLRNILLLWENWKS